MASTSRLISRCSAFGCNFRLCSNAGRYPRSQTEHMNEIVQEEVEIEKSAAKALRSVRQLLPEVPDDDDSLEIEKGLFTTKSHTLSMESAILLARQIDRAILELERPPNRTGSSARLMEQHRAGSSARLMEQSKSQNGTAKTESQNGKSVALVQIPVVSDEPGREV